MSGGAGGRAAATLKYFHFNLKFTVNYLYNYLYLKYINIRQERDGGGGYCCRSGNVLDQCSQ